MVPILAGLCLSISVSAHESRHADPVRYRRGGVCPVRFLKVDPVSQDEQCCCVIDKVRVRFCVQVPALTTRSLLPPVDACRG